MMSQCKAWVLALVGCGLLGLTGCGEQKEEGVAKEKLAGVIESYVKKEEAGRGFCTFTHPDTKQVLKLNLDRIHKDRLSKTAPNTYFACADFKGSDGKMYDLDFWVKGTPGNLQVTETHLHKVDGKERYTWKEEGGIWKPIGLKEAASKVEHPEHPN